jgi:hypothetical protein
MTDELHDLRGSIAKQMAKLADAVRGIDAARLNARPPVKDGNSAWVLAVHAAGNARAWIIGIAAGEEIGRDRPAEFASAGADAAELVAHIEQVAADIDAALAGMDRARLDVRLVPSQELWGGSPTHEISVRDAVLQVIEHVPLHLGHLELTLDLVGRRN